MLFTVKLFTRLAEPLGYNSKYHGRRKVHDYFLLLLCKSSTRQTPKNQIAGQWQRSTMYHLSSRYKPHDKPIRDLLSCGRGQQTVSFSTKPRFGRKQSKSFGIRRGQISLQFKYISTKFPYIYIH